MSTSQFLRMATLVRLTFGVTGLVRPELLGAACGMRAEDVTQETRFALRTFATRDLVLALKHLRAAGAGEAAALEALEEAAVTGVGDAVAVIVDIMRRGGVRGGLRAGAIFAVTDGIGFPMALAVARRRSALR